jgi:hypothetical protein
MPSRILITGDIFRPAFHSGEWGGASTKNIDWLFEMLSPALTSCGLSVEKTTWESLIENSSLGFNIKYVYQYFNFEINEFNWTQLINDTDFVDFLKFYFEKFLNDTLVIGYEMPPPITSALEQLNIPYIDINLHSVRFLDDLIFGMKTNVSEYIPAMHFNALDFDEVKYYVSAIKSKVLWIEKPKYLVNNTLLLLGQVSNDRALVKKQGGFYNLHDFDKEISNLFDAYNLIIFKGHPYDIKSSKTWNYISNKGDIRVVNDNFYHLLSLSQITAVVALNSGGLIESKLFDKKTFNLIPFLYDSNISLATDEKNILNTRYPQRSNWLHTSFWKYLLFNDAEARELLKKRHFQGEYIRRSMNAEWGYGFLQKNVVNLR